MSCPEQRFTSQGELIPEHFFCCAHAHRLAFDLFASDLFLHEQPALMEKLSLEPRGLPSPQAHLCAEGSPLLKNALK